MKRRTESSFVLFNVTYVDGSRSSNRRVPTSIADGLEADVATIAAIAAQDEKIALASGRPQVVIKSLTRSR
jgi:hypothetical protein